jgi:hypothetical protein
MMYGHEKSDLAIVAVKPTNKAERSAAEPPQGSRRGQMTTCVASGGSTSARIPFRKRGPRRHGACCCANARNAKLWSFPRARLQFTLDP